jgi:dihydroneopterin aldolase
MLEHPRLFPDYQPGSACFYDEMPDGFVMSMTNATADGRHVCASLSEDLSSRFRVDLRVTLEECLAAESDDLTDTVDYAELVKRVVGLVEGQSYALLERLAQVMAEAILAEFAVDAVWVRVRKLAPPIARPLQAVGVSVELRKPAG